MSLPSISPNARRDLNEIYSYIAKDNPKAAADLVDKIEDRCRMLAGASSMGFPRDELAPGLLAWPVGKYVVFYRTHQDSIDVLRIVHGSRDLRLLFG